MRLTRMNHTCSMYELGSLIGSEVKEDGFVDDLDNLLSIEFGEYKYGSIIYNTNWSWILNFKLRRKLYSLGFRQIAKYKGSGGGNVYILLKKIHQ